VKTRGIRLAAAFLAMVSLAAIPARAASGRVVDKAGKPVVDARACIMVAGAEGLCVQTDESGYFSLPNIRATDMRIVAAGFLPRTVAAVDQEAPIALDPAASLRARVLDAATGRPILKAEVRIAYASGVQKGPFPTNAAGVRVNALPPGEVVPSAKAAGYRDKSGTVVPLVAGKETVVELRLDRE
jgi:hypothetical protein